MALSTWNSVQAADRGPLGQSSLSHGAHVNCGFAWVYSWNVCNFGSPTMGTTCSSCNLHKEGIIAVVVIHWAVQDVFSTAPPCCFSSRSHRRSRSRVDASSLGLASAPLGCISNEGLYNIWALGEVGRSQALDYWLIESIGAQVFNQKNKSDPNIFVSQAGETEYTILTKSLKVFLFLFLLSIHFLLISYVLHRTLWHWFAKASSQ